MKVQDDVAPITDANMNKSVDQDFAAMQDELRAETDDPIEGEGGKSLAEAIEELEAGDAAVPGGEVADEVSDLEDAELSNELC